MMKYFYQTCQKLNICSMLYFLLLYHCTELYHRKDQHSILYESGLVVYKALKRTRWHLDVVKFAGRANQYSDGESTCDATVATLTSDTTLQQVVFEKQGNQRNPGDAKKPSWAKFNMQRDWFDCLGWNVFTDCSHIKSEDICCFQTPLPHVTNDI